MKIIRKRELKFPISPQALLGWMEWSRRSFVQIQSFGHVWRLMDIERSVVKGMAEEKQSKGRGHRRITYFTNLLRQSQTPHPCIQQTIYWGDFVVGNVREWVKQVMMIIIRWRGWHHLLCSRFLWIDTLRLAVASCICIVGTSRVKQYSLWSGLGGKLVGSWRTTGPVKPNIMSLACFLR